MIIGDYEDAYEVVNGKLINFNVKLSTTATGFSRKHGYDTTVSIVIQNLLACLKRKNVLLYGRDTSYLKKPSGRYNKHGISNWKVVKAVDVLVRDGWVMNITGIRSAVEEYRIPSLLESTPKFVEYFKLEEKEMDEHTQRYIQSLETIILRSEGKMVMDYKDNVDIKRSREILTKMNTIMSNTDVIVGATGKAIDNSCMTRIFNVDFEHGGRIYRHGVLSLPNSSKVGGVITPLPLEQTRLGLLMNGSPVVEIDYRALHLKMLFDLLDIDTFDFVKDIYNEMVGVERIANPNNRKLMKIAFNALLNSKCERSAIASIQKEINFNKGMYDFVYARDVVFAIHNTVPEIRHMFCREECTGLMLQKRDSDIAVEVIGVFADLNKPILPIHDSFIVMQEDTELLAVTMADSYRNNLALEHYVDVYLKISYPTGESASFSR